MKYIVSMRTKYGKYSTIEKDFNGASHFINWTNMMERKGHKIIGYNTEN